MRRAALLITVALAFAAGCGDDEGESTPATTTTTTSGATGATGATGAGTPDAAADATAKSDAGAVQTAIEVYATDHNGSYEGADPESLSEIEPVTSDVGVDATRDTYTLTAESESGNTFTIERAADGSTTKTCTEAGVGGCPENGEW